jgi:MerR family transcriptional regulator, light-induced transcriptional regulator
MRIVTTPSWKVAKTGLGEGGMERKSQLESRSVDFAGISPGRAYPGLQFLGEARRRETTHRSERLSEILADDIVPRLRLIHRCTAGALSPVEPLATAKIAEFAALTMLTTNDAASQYFDEMRAEALSVETLFIHLLAPTARFLEDLLEQDRCDLIDFTLGIGRLQQFIAIFGAIDPIAVGGRDHRALLITMPGERHLFDRDLVAALMHRAGWETSENSCRSAKNAAALVSHEWFALLSVTLSNRSGLETVAASIEAVRQASSNQSIRIMVGGSVFAQEPALAVQVGADAAALDAASAVVVAERLIRQRLHL